MVRLFPILLTLAILLFSTEGMSADTCPGSYNKYTWSDCVGTYTFANGDKYVGEYRNGKRHGHGTYTHANGDKYVGKYKDGRRHGQGTKTYTNGYKYVGEHKEGKRHGHGTATWASSGSKYVGEYKDNKRHGHGTYTFANGNKYVGEYKDGKKHGHGTFTWVNGKEYVGEFKDGKIHGHGTYTFANGDIYVGEFMDGKRNGHGTYTFANGDIYVGEFMDGKRNGHATYTWTDGRIYVGEWKDGKSHGHGIRFRADGTVYQEGIFENNKFLYAKKISPREETPRYTQSRERREREERERIARKRKERREAENKILHVGNGTGFAVSRSGHVITNNHVVNGCSKVNIHHKSKVIPASVLSRDTVNDLALLKGKFKPSRFFTLSRENPELMQEIFVAGYPFGKVVSSSVKVTKGIVSSLSGVGNNYSNIQIDAALQPGNSGGPIFNQKGNVVGVAVAKLVLGIALKAWKTIPENTNFGIKANVVANLLQSNNVSIGKPSTRMLSTAKLGKIATDATYYLSCWMTRAQFRKMKTKKVMFSELE